MKYLLFPLLLLVYVGTLTAQTDPPKTLLAIFAHADDEVMVMPLLARYAREGHRVYLVVVTDGAYGVTDHSELPAGPEMVVARAAEARCTAAALGIEPPVFLHYEDGHVANNWTAIHGLHRDLDSLFTRLRPEAVITWGGDGATGHPDHRFVGNIVTEVFQREGTPVDHLYYVSLPQRVLHASPDMETKYTRQIKEGLHTTRLAYLNVRVAVTEWDLVTSRRAMRCYASQWTREDADGWHAIQRAAEGFVWLRPFLGAGGAVRGGIW